jgi:hypothetical protein
MPLALDDLGTLYLPHRSTLLLLCHKKQGTLRQPIAHMVVLVILGSCIATAVFRRILLLSQQQHKANNNMTDQMGTLTLILGGQCELLEY